MKNNVTTLCYLEKDDCYLMMHRVKKEKDVNKDKWIGIGGHAEEGESPEDCLLREAKEETGLQLTEYRFRGLVTFCLLGELTEYMCLYTATQWEGEMVSECPEGNLVWVPKADISKLNLWEGDKIFFELLKKEIPFFSLKLTYEKDQLISCALNGQPLSLHYQIQKAFYEDIDTLHTLQQTAYQQMTMKEWYVPDDRQFFEDHIDRNGFILKAVSPLGDIAGFLIVRYPKEAPDNLFFDIQDHLSLPLEDALLTAHMESTAVAKEHRGHHLQELLVRKGMELAASEGYLHFCATVHPDNVFSRRNGDAAGFSCVCEKEKYGGLKRCIYYKKLS